MPDAITVLEVAAWVAFVVGVGAVLVTVYRTDQRPPARRWLDGPGFPEPKTFKEVIRAETAAGVVPEDDGGEENCA